MILFVLEEDQDAAQAWTKRITPFGDVPVRLSPNIVNVCALRPVACNATSSKATLLEYVVAVMLCCLRPLWQQGSSTYDSSVS